MVKTPKMRHSKSRREPVTIELDPGAISRITDEDAAKAETNAAETDETKAEAAAATSQPEAPEEPIHAEQADIEPWEHADAAQAGTDGSEAKGKDEAEAPYPGGEEAPKTEPRNFGYNFEDASATGTSSAASAPKPSETRSDDRGTSQPSGRAGVRTIAAGVIGGVIALAGAGLLQAVGLLGSPAPGGPSPDGVNGEIASLRGEIVALKEAGDTGASAKVNGLSSALDQVKSDVTALKSSAGQDGDGKALKALNDKLGKIETTVADLQKSGSAAPVDLGPINEKLAGLDALVKSAGDAAKTQDGRIAALEQSVQQLSGKVEAQASQPKIALAIAASALKAALDRGAPFAAELDTFAAIAPNAPEIGVLRSYAEKGVPTRATIAGEVDAAATAMVEAATPVDQNAGFFQSLVSSAESLVKVRPVGTIEGKGAPETVARLEVAVNRGDYAKALSEYDTLPDAAKSAGADFAGKLKARLEVEKQIDALIAGATKA